MLNDLILKWEDIKKQEELQFRMSMINLKLDLESKGKNLRSIVLSSNTIFPKDVQNKIIEVSNELTNLSQKPVYMGKESVNEFLESGYKVIERCKELLNHLK